MIDLYTWSTPNGRKVSIALEEMGLAYEIHPINIGKDEQFSPAFLKISPNNKIPAIIDRDNGQSVFESAAILMYLGDKTGKLYPSEAKARIRIHEWLMWQMSAIGPFLGRAHYFLKFNEGKAPFADAWFAAEAQRLYGVLDRLLADQLQSISDPEYHQSWNRMAQSARQRGQGFWWAPGQLTPDRAPDLATGLGMAPNSGQPMPPQ